MPTASADRVARLKADKMSSMCCSLLLTLALLAQDPGKGSAQGTPQGADAKKQDAAPAEASLPAPKEIPDAEAKALVAKLWKATDKLTLAQKVERLEPLRDVQNKNLVKPLTQIVQAETQLTVRKAAALALARQKPATAKPAIAQLLADDKVAAAPEVVAELVTGLASSGYASSDWPAIAAHFEKDFLPNRSLLQKQIILLAGQHKEKQAVKLLLRHLDEPIPENVDDGANPPAEYWEKRYKSWQVWREDVKESLFLVTGQRFSTRKEARAWLKVNGAKLGITDY